MYILNLKLTKVIKHNVSINKANDTVRSWFIQKKNMDLFLFQSIYPNKYDALALIHTNITICTAHAGSSFMGWHRMYLIM